MFSGPVTGDETQTINVEGLVVSLNDLIPYAKVDSLAQVETTASTALQQGISNASTITAVEAQLQAALTEKADKSELANYVTPSTLSQYGRQADVANASAVAQSALTQTSTLALSISNSLSSKADASALEQLQQQVNGKVTDDSLQASLLPYALQDNVTLQISSASDNVLTTVATTYAQKTQADAIEAAVAEKATPADIATALLPYITSQQAQTDIQLAISSADFITAAALSSTLNAYATGDSVDTLQNSIDVILARLSNSSSVLRSAPAVEGQVSFSLLQTDADFLTFLRLHVQPPLSLTQDGQVLSFGCNAHTKEEISALLQPLTTKMYMDMQI